MTLFLNILLGVALFALGAYIGHKVTTFGMVCWMLGVLDIIYETLGITDKAEQEYLTDEATTGALGVARDALKDMVKEWISKFKTKLGI